MGYVGYTTAGSLTIDNGDFLASDYGYIGYDSTATGMVTVDGWGGTFCSTWSNSSDLYGGYNGSGTLSITSGGSVSNTNGYIGYNSGSTGMVTVDGCGSTWTNSGDLYVGNSGSGTLSITNGGSVSDTVGYIGYYSGSTGMVTVDGCRLDLDQQWRPLRRQLRQRDALEHHQRRQRQQYRRLHRLLSGSTGTVTVDGAGSTWTNSGDLYVGNSAAGR